MGLAGASASPRKIYANPDDHGAAPRSVAVVSLNTAKVTDADRIVRDIQSAPRLRSADVFLLQEVANEDTKASVADQMAHKLGYFVAFSPAAPGVFDQGLAIVSRYPILDVEIKRLKECNLRFRSRQRFALAANLRTPWGDVRVWNAHLDTRINSEERADQLAPVIEDAAKHTGPRLIGGDFNTNDLRWVGNVVPLPGGPNHGQAIRRAMEQRGFVTPFVNAVTTFPVFQRQLDWIFIKDLVPVASSVEPAPFSDHYAIWTRVRIPAI